MSIRRQEQRRVHSLRLRVFVSVLLRYRNPSPALSDLTFPGDSLSTRDTLQDTARIQFENNKRARRHVFAQAAQKGTERTPDAVIPPPPPKMRHRNGSGSHRLRSGSGASRMTGGTTSESDFDGPSSLLHGHYTSNSPMSSPSTHSTNLPSAGSHYNQISSGTASTFSMPSPSLSVHSHMTAQSTLSPIATRMLERDADAMEKYKRRNRSGSAGTTSTDAPSQVDWEETVSPMNPLVNGSVQPRRLLRPSASAAQLRSNGNGLVSKGSQEMLRSRSGMNAIDIPSSGTNSSFSTINENQTNGSSNSNVTTPTRQKPGTSIRTLSGHTAGGVADDRDGNYTGPSELYAQFPPPAATPRLPPVTKVSPPTTKGADRSGRGTSGTTPTTTSHRRIPFHLLSKPLPPIEAQFGHRRGTSTT
jgi:hypothetical protein